MCPAWQKRKYKIGVQAGYLTSDTMIVGKINATF